MGKRGGDRVAELMHNRRLGTDALTSLSTGHAHRRLLEMIPGAVICFRFVI